MSFMELSGVREAETKVYGRYHGTRHCDVNIVFVLDSLVLSIGRETAFSIEGIWSWIDFRAWASRMSLMFRVLHDYGHDNITPAL